MRRKPVPLARRHAVQAKVAMVVDRTVHWAALILMHVSSDKGRLGRPHRSGEHPRDPICAVLAREQTVALPFVLFQHVNTEKLQQAQQGVDGALEASRLLARHQHRSGAHADIFVTPAAFMALQACGRLWVFGRVFLSSPSAEMTPSQPTNAFVNFSSLSRCACASTTVV